MRTCLPVEREYYGHGGECIDELESALSGRVRRNEGIPAVTSWRIYLFIF